MATWGGDTASQPASRNAARSGPASPSASAQGSKDSKRTATPAFGAPVRTLAELVALHAQHQAAGLRASSRLAYAKRWRTLHRVIQPITPLAHIDRPRVQQVIADLTAAGLAPLTVRHLAGTLTATLVWGVEAGITKQDPRAGVKMAGR